MTTITLRADIDLDEIIETLHNDVDDSKIAEFIEALDLKVGDWDFTKRMYTYFRKEMLRSESDGGDSVAEIDAEIAGLPLSDGDGDDDDDEDPDDDAEDDGEDDDVEEDEEEKEDGQDASSDKSRKMGEWG